jgi:hypothetical protein
MDAAARSSVNAGRRIGFARTRTVLRAIEKQSAEEILSAK